MKIPNKRERQQIPFNHSSDIRFRDFMNDCNWTRTYNHLVRKRTLNHLVKLAK